MEVHIGAGFGLLVDDLVPCLPCVDRQKVGVELNHVLGRIITFPRGFLYDLQGLLKLSLDPGAWGG